MRRKREPDLLDVMDQYVIRRLVVQLADMPKARRLRHAAIRYALAAKTAPKRGPGADRYVLAAAQLYAAAQDFKKGG